MRRRHVGGSSGLVSPPAPTFPLVSLIGNVYLPSGWFPLTGHCVVHSIVILLSSVLRSVHPFQGGSDLFPGRHFGNSSGCSSKAISRHSSCVYCGPQHSGCSGNKRNQIHQRLCFFPKRHLPLPIKEAGIPSLSQWYFSSIRSPHGGLKSPGQVD